MGRVVLLTPPAQNRSRLLRVARERSGLDHATFARRLGALIGRPQLGPGAVRRWENDDSPPPAEVLAAAGAISRGPPAPIVSTNPPLVEVASERGDLIDRLRSAKRVDAAVIARLRHATDAFRYVDREQGSAPISVQLAAHLDRLRGLWSHSAVPGTRRALATAVSEAASLAGWQALDRQQLDAAWDFHELAKLAAAEGQDSCAQAFATAQQSLVLLDAGRVPDAVALVSSAKRRTSRLPPRLRAWLHSAEAEVLAAAGKPAQAQHALAAADAVMPNTPPDPALPYVVLDGVHLARWRGSALAHLGDQSAVDELSSAVAGMDSTFTRAGAGLHADLALALARSGELEQAITHINDATRLADAAGSTRQRQRIRQRAALIKSLRTPTS